MKLVKLEAESSILSSNGSYSYLTMTTKDLGILKIIRAVLLEEKPWDNEDTWATMDVNMVGPDFFVIRVDSWSMLVASEGGPIYRLCVVGDLGEAGSDIFDSTGPVPHLVEFYSRWCKR